jgi:hypothetical protein
LAQRVDEDATESRVAHTLGLMYATRASRCDALK